MTLKKIFLFCLFLQFTSYTAIPQSIKWREVQYTAESGLSNDEVLTVAQDSVGYMWFGSVNGLNRFDGINFKIYTTSINDSNSIPDNNIFKILNDSKGRLLIATAKGLCIYNRLHDNFTRININEGSVKSGFSIWTILEDKYGNYWLGTQGAGLIKISYNFHFIHQYGNSQFDNSGLSSNYIWSLYEDKEGIIWIGDQEGNICSLNPYYGKIDKNLSTNYSSIIDDIIEDNNGNLIVCSFSGVKFYKPKKVLKNLQSFIELHNIKLLDNNLNERDRVYQCLYGFDHNLWFLDKKGFRVYNSLTNSIIQSASAACPFGIPYSNISQQLISDKQGNIWIGTHKTGIVLFNKMYKNFLSSGVKYKDKLLTSIFEDSEGNLWIGINGEGIYYTDNKKGITMHFSSDNVSKYGFNTQSDFVTYETADHELFIGTYEGLYSYNKKTSHFKNYIYNPQISSCINHYDIRDIFEDPKGKIWVATNGGGINILDRETRTFSHIMKNVNHPDSGIVDNYCLHFLNDKNGNLWIGTYNGFTKYDRTNNRFYNFSNDNKTILSQNWVVALCEDEKSNIWMGTANGVDVYDQKSNTFKYYFKKDGLPDNVISGLQSDKNGNIWISTAQGLCKYDNSSKKFITYTKADGLEVTDYSLNCCFKNKKGELYFGGNGGYVSFSPDEIKQNPYSPKVIITNLKLFYENVPVSEAKNSVLKQQISHTKEITLNYNQNFITFEYIALNYLNPEKNQYSYQLVGFDKKWWNVGPRREVTYTNLNPGNYIFRVKASNSDGVWNNNPTEIIIHIIPPFWKTAWFICLLIIMTLSLAFSYYRYRVKNIVKRNQELEDIVIERTEEIRLQNHVLEDQADRLNETNALLEERQQHIEEQSEEILAQRDQLSQLNATKDKLFSILAHDLRNPFNIILGYSELLVSDFKKLSEEKINKFLDSIHKSAFSGNTLLDNILQWSRAQTGRISYEPEEQHLLTVSNEVINLLEGNAQQKEITICQLITPDIVVFADENMLKTILRNLISNAIKFTPVKGQITLSAEISIDNTVVVTVSDTGVGIPEPTIKNLFEINNTVSTKGTAKETGTGLGLIICKEFVSKHKGKIWVQSQVNNGSTFYFQLPHKG